MAEERESLRCPHCKLVQFLTHDGKCRRCCQHLIPPPEPIQITLPMIIEPRRHPFEWGLHWGQLLMNLRLERRMSQKQLARKASMTRTFISKMEHRMAPPTFHTIKRLAIGLKIPTYVLVDVHTGYGYYYNRFLLRDPFIVQLRQDLPLLDQEQRAVVMQAVRSLVEHNQLLFPEWQRIGPNSCEIGEQRCSACS
jgi:transcriptional regulator with XRE-family HTH domain